MDKMGMLAEMMKKKKDMEPMDESEKNIKMGILKDLHSEMGKMLGQSMLPGAEGDLKKVTIAAPDKEGLEMGLSKAEDMLDQDSESPEHEAAEGSDEGEDMDEASIDEQIKKLQEMKAKKMMKA